MVPPVPMPETRTSIPPSVSARDGASGSDAGDEDIDTAFGILPDLGPGGSIMDIGIGRVLELLQQHIVAGIGSVDLLCLGNGAFHAETAFRESQFRARRFEQRLL